MALLSPSNKRTHAHIVCYHFVSLHVFHALSPAGHRTTLLLSVLIADFILMKKLGETIMRQGNMQQRQQMESPSSPGTTLFQIYWVIQITVVIFRGGLKVSQFESDPALVKTGICLVMCENEMNSQIYNSSPNVITGKTRRREERIAFSHLC